MGRSQPSEMPPLDSFHNNFQTALACGHYSVLSSMYAVIVKAASQQRVMISLSFNTMKGIETQ